MNVRECDVACIGAGGAGVTAAVTAAAAGARVLLLSKEPIGYGNTRISVGVVASCGILPADDPDVFYEDLVVGGEHLNNPKLARVMAEEAAFAPAIAESQGNLFERDAEGGISASVARRAGGHRYHRSVRTPGKGVALGQALRAAAARSNIDVLEEMVTVKLLRDGGRIAGLVAWDLAAGEPVVVRAPAVIVATGGLGWIYYPHTDCIRGATGDGYALAYEAGADLVDMEQVQFLPFACTHPTSMVGIFLGEPSFAGPHGRLLDGQGRELLTGLQTMTRAQVSRVIGLELQKGNGTKHGGLLLDLRPNLETPQGRAAWQTAKDAGLNDIAKRAYGPKAYAWEEPWDVAPTVHFQMGGLRIDEHGATTVAGLYAAGEAAGGVHGACRLGSVALAELFVFGRRAGLAAAEFARGGDRPPLPRDEASDVAAHVGGLLGARGEHRPVALVRQVQRLMWDKVGVVREEKSLSAAVAELSRLSDQARSLRIGPQRRQNLELLEALELRGMLLTADLVTRSALCRRETRGAHIRADHPERDDARWLANIVVQHQDGRPSLAVEPIDSSGGPRNGPPLPPALGRARGGARTHPRNPGRASMLRHAPIPVSHMITITVQRYDVERGADPVLETYEVPVEDGATVMDALLYIYETHESNLAFRCGCRNRDCGLCAVDVNGRPRLACVTTLKKGMVIRPLGRLPVARDLIVDRRWIMPFLERFDLFVRHGSPGEWPQRLAVPAEHSRLAACTECLSCLAACPSFEFGHDDLGRGRAPLGRGRAPLGGPYHFVKLAQLHWDPRDRTDRHAQAAQLGIARCADCRKCACPLGIPIYRAAVAPLGVRQ